MTPIYLDHQATTPLDADALAAMTPYFQQAFGNPHSSTHRAGREAKAGVDIAREQIAAALGANPAEIIFTSGATEANNLALRGVMEASPRSRNRLVTLVTEHSCVLETARDLEQRGFALTLVPVQKNGLVDLSVLRAAMGDDVVLVSVMAANNEIGVLQPTVEIAALAHDHGALFHSDAAQGFGKVPMNVVKNGVDFLSISAHKIYGPKGIGALFVKSGTKLRAQMTGGGQEAGVRSGTLSPALCAGFGAAAKKAVENLAADGARMAALFDQALERLAQSNLHYVINGDLFHRLKSNLSITFPGIDGARLISDARGVMMSSGSACASQPGRLSHVLSGISLADADIKSTIRLGFGRSTTATDIDTALTLILDAVAGQGTLSSAKKSA